MIENHVTSLELSKKLAELGIKQESEFYWFSWLDENGDPKSFQVIDEQMAFVDNESIRYSAFLASELLSILKAFITISKNVDSDEITVYYQPEHVTDNSYTLSGTNLANLLAQVIIAKHREGEFK